MGEAMRIGVGWRLACGCDVLATDEGQVWRVLERRHWADVRRRCQRTHLGEVVTPGPGAAGLVKATAAPVVIVVESLDDAGAVRWTDRAAVADGDTLRVGSRGFVGLVAAVDDDDGDVCGCAVCRAQRSPHAAEELERPLVRVVSGRPAPPAWSPIQHLEQRLSERIEALRVRVAHLERKADGRG